MGLVPRGTWGRESVTISVSEHRVAGAVAGPVVTGAVVTRRKRCAVHLGTGKYVVLRKVWIPVNA